MSKRILIFLLFGTLAAGGGYYAYREFWQADAQPAAAGRPGGPGSAGPTPVVAIAAALGAVDVIMNGLGTATPLRTVTVRSRVDGELLRVLFDEGQIVQQGQLLAEIDARPFQVQLAQAEGQLARDRALLENAQLDLERYRALFAQDSIAKQQVDTQASLVRQYEGAIQMDRSQVESARLQLVYTRVTAPVGGRVGLRLVDPGNIVRAGDTTGLVVITQLQPVAVVFTVPQDSVPVVLKRMQSGETIPVEAWDRELKTKLAQGALASADNQVDPATGTVKLKAQFSNDDRALFPNQFVNVRMKLDTLRDVIVIPSAAVQRGAQGLFVYVVGPDKTVQQRAVKLGPTEGQYVAITDGLAQGEMVVVDGMDRLRPGAAVEVAAQRPEIKPPAEGKGAGKGAGKGQRRKAPEGG
ncbi:MAG TPA: MdtA/MuxA family multidrug efflux RND transporter periplasmic adaptor subunit [Burkholderiales bacterium]|nr:MdtA/MuxA family multidrug efflux RND transporter periplasmic adaptor subunit [Burkholderiales bacterium]